jgi:hypothetical protein
MELQQLNIQLPQLNIQLPHTNKIRVFNILMSGYWRVWTYDNEDNELTTKSSTGYWSNKIYNKSGEQLTFNNGYTKT